MKEKNYGAILVAALFFQTEIWASPVDYESGRSVTQARDCGITARLPADLISAGYTQFQPCSSSYKSASGAVFSFAPSDNGIHDSNWLDRIPVLHVRKVPIDVERRSGFGRNFSTAPVAPKECNVTENTTIRRISGRNWRGWLAEDLYLGKYPDTQKNDRCVLYSPDHRCVRVMMGNERQSATMAQYCLSGDDSDFDLDDGINFKIFIEIIGSIEFVEG